MTVTATVDAGDLAAPDTAITSPSAWANPPGVALTGTAGDNQAVARVDVALQNLDTGQWWDATTRTWVAPQRWNPASLTTPGAPATAWSFPFTLPAGRWHLQARATDAAGLVDASQAKLSFRTA